MELKNGVIWNTWEPLQELARTKLPVKVSFQVAQLITKLRDPYLIVEGQRLGFVQELGTKAEDGRGMKVEEGTEAHATFIKKMNELFDLNQTVPLDEKWQKVKLPEQVDGRVVEVEPRILLALQDFVELA